MTTMTETSVPTQVYRVYIKATPQAIWDAITTPEWTERYGYGGLVDYDLRAGGRFVMRPGAAMAASPGVPDVIVDGEVVEAEPPRRLVQTWRMLMDPGLTAEGFTRVSYEIGEPGEDGVTRLTVTHDLTNAPTLAALVRGDSESAGGGGGWSWILSDLKTLLETGTAFQG
jgi:uncharacterized protein YndB with AHSA1/START domain